ncbi:MAG: CCA tRNA nucleotidyltransferase [Dehalococcoidia bacterium]|nr:MAG: CCA tRNA nucleotidyltransferase [Dehalococcoidia bacterium]
MPLTANIAGKIDKRLPIELISFLRQAGELATARGETVYLVGGAVRDLLLDKKCPDIDLAVEGEATTLARDLIKDKSAEITIHPHFNTAKICWSKWSIDLATTRRESYSQPGALPDVKPGFLKDDLFRRDFSINAMAASLNPENYGRLIDPYGGRKDLNGRLIRILHEKSFIDDSTRIWRGLRYEQRLNFMLEAETLTLLQRDIPMLDTISGDRIRYELECILNEERPEKILQRAGELGILKRLNPSLIGNGWLAEKFSNARQTSLPHKPPPELYMALLTYWLTDKEREQFISYLRLSKPTIKILRDSGSIRGKINQLADSSMKPSTIYHLLHGNLPQAITANIIASDSEKARSNMRLYMHKLSKTRPLLNGDDLTEMDITPGPLIKQILNKLLDARLDGEVKTRRDEERVVRSWDTD